MIVNTRRALKQRLLFNLKNFKCIIRNFFSVYCSVEFWNLISWSRDSFSNRVSIKITLRCTIGRRNLFSLAKSFHWNVSFSFDFVLPAKRRFCICERLFRLKICLFFAASNHSILPSVDWSWITFEIYVISSYLTSAFHFFPSRSFRLRLKERKTFQNGKHAQHEQQHVNARSETISSGIFAIFANTVWEPIPSATASEFTCFQHEFTSIQ